jgi:hypothetical protein
VARKGNNADEPVGQGLETNPKQQIHYPSRCLDKTQGHGANLPNVTWPNINGNGERDDIINE